MAKNIIYLNFILYALLFANLSNRIFSMKINDLLMKADEKFIVQYGDLGQYEYIKSIFSDIDSIRLKLIFFIVYNDPVNPFTGVKKFIKSNILKDVRLPNLKLSLKYYLFKFGYSFIKIHFAGDKINQTQEERNERFKSLLSCDDFSSFDNLSADDFDRFEKEVASLIFAGVDRDISINCGGFEISPLNIIFWGQRFIRLANLLIKSDININVNDQNGNSFLMKLFFKKSFYFINILLSRPDLNINYKDPNGFTILMHALFANNLEFIDLILSKKLNIDLSIKDNLGNNVLDYAKIMGNKDAFIKIAEFKNLIINSQKSLDDSELLIIYLDPSLNSLDPGLKNVVFLAKFKN